MICPYYKNRKVFDGFNEMVEAFGGEPMTEEEFRSAELRNLRTGRNFAAMEAAYRTYDRNGGNFLDFTPDGKPSILFQKLLDYNKGDRVKALILKSNVYSDNFFNWFGDWINDKENASKVVDENGEPLIVYHGTDSNFNEFKSEYNNKSFKGFFFTDDETMASSYGKNLIPVYLNIKDAYNVVGNNKFWNEVTISTKDVAKNLYDQIRLHQNNMRLLMEEGKIDKETYDYWDNKYYKPLEKLNSLGNGILSKIKKFIIDFKLKSFKSDGDYVYSTRRIEKVLEYAKDDISIIFDSIIDYGSRYVNHDFSAHGVYVITNPNRAKRVTNLGEFSLTDNDLNAILVTRTIQNGQLFETASLSWFGDDIMSRLMNGEDVMSSELVQHLLSNGALSLGNIRLANILSRHNIPVVLDSSVGQFTLAVTETNKKTGLSIIKINPKLINQVSKGYLGESILHEVVHGVTVNAINNPTTEIELRFVDLNRRVYTSMANLFPEHSALFDGVDLGTYALKNEKEFAAVFITDREARDVFFRLARQLDELTNGKFINIFKRFINSLVNLFVNKTVFNTNEALMKEYQKQFIDYLSGAPIQNAQKLSAKLIMELYDNIDRNVAQTESLIERMKHMQAYADAVERNNIDIVLRFKNKKEKDRTFSFDEVVKKLQIRINALRTSDLKLSEKFLYIKDTKTQIDMFINQQTSKYVAITSTLRQIIPHVLKSVQDLKNILINESLRLSGKSYMYESHSHILMYNEVAKELLGLISQESTKKEIIDEYNKNIPEDQRITEKDIQELKTNIENLLTVTSEGEAVLKILRDRAAMDIARDRANQEGGLEDIEEYITNMTENPTFDDDISWFELNLGAMDSASNSMLRILSNIVNRALKKADNATIEKTTKLLELLAALGSKESVLDLYELDENGRTTGYLIRKLNYGKFYKAYDNELLRINKLFNDLFKDTQGYKLLELDGRIAPQGPVGEIKIKDDDVKKLGLETEKITHLPDGTIKKEHIDWTLRSAWNELKNRWLYDNCERKYNKRYYDAWNKVPQIAKEALDSINQEIASILAQPGILGEDGHYHYDKLSNKDWDALQNLWIEKKLLRSDYDMFGNLKEEGSTPYIIAKSLLQLNKDLYGDQQQKIKKDKKAWQDALDEEIKQCGGKEAYNKWRNKEKDHGFNVKRFKKWHLRNSRLEFKKDKDGNAIIFKDIENAMQGFSIDYGEIYNALSEKARELLKPYKSQNGEVNAAELPEATKNLLLEIYEQQYNIKRQVLSDGGEQLRNILAKYKEVFESFIVYKDTEYFKLIKKLIEKMSINEDGVVDDVVYDVLMSLYGTEQIDEIAGWSLGFRPHRWLQRMEAVDKEKYMEYEPGDAWVEKVDNEDLLNKNFDEKEGTAFVPKESKYSNKTAFSKIENSTTLKALYDEVKATMAESNELQTNRLYADNFLLPQQTGSVWKRMKRHSIFGAFKELYKYIKESLGIGYNPNDFKEIGSSAAADEESSEGITRVNKIPVHGKYPDGRTFHILPQYYTRKLDDPSQISSDLVNILSNYYKMSQYYAEKVKIKDDCETIVDFLKARDEKRTSSLFKNENNSNYDQTQGSRTTRAANKFLEMNLYDMRRTNHSWGNWLWSKTISLWKNWTTRRNLGMNPKVALTGFLTALGVHMLNIVSGQNYGIEGVYAFVEVLRRIGQSIFGVRYLGNPLSNDDMNLMTEHYEIANSFERKKEGTNRWRPVLVLYKHSIFGMLSSADYWAKSVIMTAILMNHHYVDGKFLSKEDILNSRYLCKSKEEFNALMDKWRRGPNLYKLLKAKNHKITVDTESNQKIIDEYNESLPLSLKITLKDIKNAFDLTDDIIKDRVQKTAEYADGMATDLQRAAITLSLIGAFVLIHKQYLPLILQRYFGKRVYDYDTHQYKNGVFRTFFSFISQVMQNNIFAGIGAGVFTGNAFFGLGSILGVGSVIGVGPAIGIAAAIGTRMYGAYKHKRGAESKSINLIWNETFNDFSSKKSTAYSYANRRDMKNVLYTVGLYRLLIQPIVALICSIADDDDDDKWWLQLLAYSMRAFEWEFYTAFRTDDMLNTFKSPTAATSVLDAMESLGGSITNTISPQGNFLFDPSQTWDDFENLFGSTEEKRIKKGTYKGWLPAERDFVKGLAVHNLIEQLSNSKAKRKYLENQIMRIPKKE